MMVKLNKKDRIQLIITAILIIILIALVYAFSQRKNGLPAASQRDLPGRLVPGRNFKFDPQRNKGTSFVLDRAFGEIIGIKRDPFSYGGNK